jgi:membrane protein implicated in regulation of membrane protease activity
MLDFLTNLPLTAETIFWACLFIGAALGIISIVVGDILDFAFDTGEFGPFSGPIVASFLIIFGGAGLVCRSILHLGPAASIGVATIVAFCGSALLYFMVAKLIFSQEGSTSYNPQEWIGTEAEVITEIPPDGVGEITFDTHSGRIGGPARSADGTRIRHGVIVRIEKHLAGTFTVRELNAPAPANKPQTDSVATGNADAG